MYLGSWDIDDYVPIPAATHRFSSGASYAPTSLTYSIYEDVGTTGLDEDVDMTPASPFDGVTGAYLARRQLTAAAGFEAGKNYTVLVKATVDGVSAIEWHTFQIRAKVDARAIGGTVQTGRDLGASVLISSGTGAGQLDVTSGVVKANLVQILATALTETAGQIAAGFKKFFNVATPTGTVNSLPDAVAGATGGVAIVGSAMKGDVGTGAGQFSLSSGKIAATLASADVSGDLPVEDAVLAASQPNYAPAKAGDAMALATTEGDTLAHISSVVDQLIRRLRERYISCRGWDGTRADVIDTTYSVALGGASIQLWASDIDPYAGLTPTQLGTLSGGGWAKDAGWTTVLGSGDGPTLKLAVVGALPAGQLTLTVDHTSFGPAGVLVVDMPAGASSGFITADGHYIEGWVGVPAGLPQLPDNTELIADIAESVLDTILASVIPGDYPTAITYKAAPNDEDYDTITWASGMIWEYQYNESNRFSGIQLGGA